MTELRSSAGTCARPAASPKGGAVPSMDDILRDGARRERKRELQLGVLLVGGGLAVALGMYALAWSAGGIVLVPTGAIALGLARIGRAVMRRPSRD